MAGVVRKNGLNILALLIAVPVLLYSLSVSTPHTYVMNARAMLGAASATMGASVGANPDNTLAAQLAAEQQRIDQEKADLAASESQKQNGLSIGEMLGVSSFFISVVLLILVALNFYYDSKREKFPQPARKFFVDLR
jgi:hypothetical protein